MNQCLKKHDVLSLLDFEISQISGNQSLKGWTPWIFFSAAGGLIWTYVTDSSLLQAPETVLFANLTLIGHAVPLLGSLATLLKAETVSAAPSPDKITIFPEFLLSQSRQNLVLFLMYDLTLLVATYQFVSAFTRWWPVTVLYSAFQVVGGLITLVFGSNRKLNIELGSKIRKNIRLGNKLVILLEAITFSFVVFYFVKFTQIFSPKLAVLLAGLFGLRFLLSHDPSTDPTLAPMKELRRELTLNKLSTHDALNDYERLMLGQPRKSR